MKIADLSEKEFKALLGDVIEEKLREMLDPDYGLELRADFAKRLKASIASRELKKTSMYAEAEVVEVFKLACTRCGHTWTTRSMDLPKICPSCNSPYWDRPRKKAP